MKKKTTTRENFQRELVEVRFKLQDTLHYQVSDILQEHLDTTIYDKLKEMFFDNSYLHTIYYARESFDNLKKKTYEPNEF